MGDIINTVVEATSDNLANQAKESMKTEALSAGGEMMADIAIDSVAGFIPVIGNAISGYRKNKAINNLNVFIQELHKRVSILEEANKSENKDYQEKIDDFYVIGSDITVKTTQEEKIKYIANGVLNSIKNDFSYDISILYFSVLERMTILELEILKKYNQFIFDRGEDWVSEIIESFNINMPGFKAAKSNLIRAGLLQNKTESYLQHDIDEITDALITVQNDINKTVEYINSSTNKRKLKTSKSKKVKNKTKDSVSISKFGKDFVEHFITDDTL